MSKTIHAGMNDVEARVRVRAGVIVADMITVATTVAITIEAHRGIGALGMVGMPVCHRRLIHHHLVLGTHPMVLVSHPVSAMGCLVDKQERHLHMEVFLHMVLRHISTAHQGRPILNNRRKARLHTTLHRVLTVFLRTALLHTALLRMAPIHIRRLRQEVRSTRLIHMRLPPRVLGLHRVHLHREALYKAPLNKVGLPVRPLNLVLYPLSLGALCQMAWMGY